MLSHLCYVWICDQPQRLQMQHWENWCSTETTAAVQRQMLQYRDNCCDWVLQYTDINYSTETSATVHRHQLQYRDIYCGRDICYSTETSTAVETSATVQRHLLRQRHHLQYRDICHSTETIAVALRQLQRNSNAPKLYLRSS